MIDNHYARLVSSRLEKFKELRAGVFTFRCPYCGDSQKYKNKTRGYFFAKKSGLVYKCHNCGVGRSFGNFLKDHAQDLYDEYVLERYKSGLTGKGRNVADPEFLKPKKLKFKKKSELQSCNDLNNEHQALGYLLGRKIPPQFFTELYYTDKFCTWVNTLKPTFDNIKKDHPRIIIPFIDEQGEWFGFQGRSLNPDDKLRYITIMLDESRTKVYGLNRLNLDKTIYITEGPFDSLYIDNAIAMAGADVDWDFLQGKEVVFVYDNEKRSREIVNRMSTVIDRGFEIVIWPDTIGEKDLNDMYLSGHDVQSLVEFNTYSGLEAQIKLSEWKKV